MIGFTIAFIALLATAVAIRVWLDSREAGHARANRLAVPAPFKDRVTRDEYRRAADYTVAKTRFATAVTLIEAILLIGWTVGGGLDLLDQVWRSLHLPPLAIGVGVIVSTLLLMLLFGLPQLAYRLFVVEQRFGFNRATASLFASDVLKKAMLLIAVAAPLAALAVTAMENTGPWWWLYLWGLWMGFIFLKTWAYPTLVAPLFNRFMPLRDDEMERRIGGLLSRCGMALGRIQVMDGSRRSSHGNAYVTGIGNSKRIVLLDTLLEALEPDEIEAVLAHEVGHVKRGHVHKTLAAMAVASGGGSVLFSWLAGQPDFYNGLGISQPSPHSRLALAMLLSPIVGVFVKPLVAAASRRLEFEADAFAVGVTDPRTLLRALAKLDRKNIRMLTSDVLYAAFHHSHPSPLVREARLWAVSNAARPRGTGGRSSPSRS